MNPERQGVELPASRPTQPVDRNTVDALEPGQVPTVASRDYDDVMVTLTQRLYERLRRPFGTGDHGMEARDDVADPETERRAIGRRLISCGHGFSQLKGRGRMTV